MNSKRTREFRELYNTLPASAQHQAVRAYAQFRRDHDYPGLNFKPLSTHPGWFSARIGLHHRALCFREGNIWVWFWIGSHAAYDDFLKQS